MVRSLDPCVVQGSAVVSFFYLFLQLSSYHHWGSSCSLSLWSLTSTPADYNVHISDPSKNMGVQLTLSSPALSCSFLLSDTHLCGHVLYLLITATCKTPRPHFRHLIPSLSFPHTLPSHTGLTNHSQSLFLIPLLDNSQMQWSYQTLWCHGLLTLPHERAFPFFLSYLGSSLLSEKTGARQ